MTCSHPDDHLTVSDRKIECQDCGQQWLAVPPKAYAIRRMTYREMFHPDDVELIYDEPEGIKAVVGREVARAMRQQARQTPRGLPGRGGHL